MFYLHSDQARESREKSHARCLQQCRFIPPSPDSYIFKIVLIEEIFATKDFSGKLTVGKTATSKGKDRQKPNPANAVKVGVCTKETCSNKG